MISRRKFLILAGASAIATMLPLQISAKTLKSESMRRWAMVADVEKCTRCVKEFIERTGNEEVKPPCVVACDRENNVPDFEEKAIDPQWIRIAKFKNKYGDEFYAPLLCNHCENPPCAQVCLTQATFKRS
ncbi:MAG: 4Fe-4S dicluster domain-containing protein, partial [Archaeoglobaceae archaeon]